MAAHDFDRTAWIGTLERAVGRLLESAKMTNKRLPPVTNDEYRTLWKQAEFDTNAREFLNQYLPELNADPTEVVNLLSQHPAISPNAAAAGNDIATFVEMPSKAFRMELRTLARNLARSAIKCGCRDATTHLERFLTLSIDKAHRPAREARQAEKKRKGLHCLSGWNGHHRGFSRIIERELQDPDSMKAIQTMIGSVNEEGKHRIAMEFSAKNRFGGRVRYHAIGQVSNDTCDAKLIEIK